MSASEDEFDHFPDSFSAGIDWDSVPGLSSISVPSQFNLPTADCTPALEEQRSLASGEHSVLSSSQYSFDEVDDAFLAEIDKAERRLLQSNVAGPSTDRTEGASTHSNHSNDGSELVSRFFHEWHAEDPSSLQSGDHEMVKDMNSHAEGSRGNLSPVPGPEVESTKVVHELSSPIEGPSHKRRKGKKESSSRKILKEYLNNLEDEMICPICCDIFAVAHLGNPCGHTFCGECGWRWIKKNREAPSCAICRASLSVDAPMIPNFAVDNAIEKHVQALRTSGVEGWECDGTKSTEWEARKARWKAVSTKLMARKNTTTSLTIGVASYALQGSSPGGSEYERETGSSGGGSSGSNTPLEPTNRRRARNSHHDHQRRTGGNRRSRVVEHHDARGGSGPRVRRTRRRRRD